MQITSDFRIATKCRKNKFTIKAYIKEAIKNDTAGLKVKMKAVPAFEISKEFLTALTEMQE